MTQTIFSSSSRSLSLTNLNEDSSYTITVRAINTVGSTMATITAETSIAGDENLSSQQNIMIDSIVLSAPSHVPGPFNFNANLTSITVSWTELPCSDRNGEITGYTVEYSSTRPPHTGIINVPGLSTTRLVVGGLLPRTLYSLSVRAVGALGLMGFSTSESSFTSTPSGQKNECKKQFVIIKYVMQVLVSSLMEESSLITVQCCLVTQERAVVLCSV